MSNVPGWIVGFIVVLLKAIFQAEKTKKPGKVKKNLVLSEISEPIVKNATGSDVGKYFSLAFRLIEAFVKIFNEIFGKNGWSDLGGDDKKTI